MYNKKSTRIPLQRICLLLNSSAKLNSASTVVVATAFFRFKNQLIAPDDSLKLNQKPEVLHLFFMFRAQSALEKLN